MRDASATPARHGFTCACCGWFTLTGIDGLFSNPQPGSPKTHHANTTAAPTAT